jgi:DNA-binding protein HU-beta
MGVLMNKTDLVNAIADETESNKAEAMRFLEAMIKVFTESLQRGETVQVPNFGTFAAAFRAARKGVNPRTGEAMEISASTGIKFKAGKALKDALNSKEVVSEA